MGILIELVIAALILIGYGIKKFVSRNQDYWKKRGITHIKYKNGFFVSTYQLITKKKNVVEFDIDLYKELGKEPYGGTVDFGQPNILVRDLELIKLILVKDFDHFVDRRQLQLQGKEKKILNDMLTSLEGQEWKDVRSVMSPTFTTGKIRRMFEHFNKCGGDLIEFIKTKPVGSPGTRDVEMKEFVNRYLTDVIGATAFGMETNSLKDPNSMFYKMVKQFSEFSLLKMLKAILVMALPFLSKFGIRFTDGESMDFFETILRNALKTRQGSSEKRDDFLQILIEARKGDLKTDDSELDAFEKDAQLVKAGEKVKVTLSDDQIIAQSMLFFLAGSDTTSSVICFTYYLLALHQEIQAKLYEEVSGATKDGNFDYETINKMEYLDKVVSEILRMYPPAARLERRCTRDWNIPGTQHKIEKDTLVFMPMTAMHNDPELFPNPEKFDPERFTPEAKAARNPYTYMPFGQGPRNCIGMRFALMQAKVAVAYIVNHFLIEPAEQTPVPVKIDPNFGVRPDPTVILRFKERSI